MFGLRTTIGMAIALALSLGWGARLNHLRQVHQDNVEAVVKVLHEAGYTKVEDPKDHKIHKVDEDRAFLSIGAVLLDLGQTQKERDAAQFLVEVQSNSIKALEDESEQNRLRAEANRRMAEAAVKERNAWIARAKAAQTRTERLSAEQEAEECAQIADDLYHSGF